MNNDKAAWWGQSNKESPFKDTKVELQVHIYAPKKYQQYEWSSSSISPVSFTIKIIFINKLKPTAKVKVIYK